MEHREVEEIDENKLTCNCGSERCEDRDHVVAKAAFHEKEVDECMIVEPPLYRRGVLSRLPLGTYLG